MRRRLGRGGRRARLREGNVGEGQRGDGDGRLVEVIRVAGALRRRRHCVIRPGHRVVEVVELLLLLLMRLRVLRLGLLQVRLLVAGVGLTVVHRIVRHRHGLGLLLQTRGCLWLVLLMMRRLLQVHMRMGGLQGLRLRLLRVARVPQVRLRSAVRRAVGAAGDELVAAVPPTDGIASGGGELVQLVPLARHVEEDLGINAAG